MQEPKAKLKNSSPKQGMSLHKFIATGGKPKNHKGMVGAVHKSKSPKDTIYSK